MKSKGFTLIELVVVVMIITLLSTVILAGIQTNRAPRALKSAVQELAVNIRKAQSMAISTQRVGEEVPCGYGLYFDKTNPTSYILFAETDSDPDCANINRLYNGPSERVRIIKFSSSLVEIASTEPDPFSIFFIPPDPETSINYPSVVSEATITLKAKGDLSVKRVRVNIAGRVEIE